MLRNNRIGPEHILVVELVGLAGAGKTTLSQVLVQHSEKIIVGAEISLRKIQFKQAPSVGEDDSLFLFLNFKDGNGDFETESSIFPLFQSRFT